MGYQKRRVVQCIILLIGINYILNTVLDVSRLFSYNQLYNVLPNEMLKRANVLLSLLLVWIAGKDSLNKADAAYMKLIFIIISLGEVFFLAGNPFVAIFFFLVCQILLIVRNSKGLPQGLAKAGAKNKLLLLMTSTMLCAVCIFVIIFLYPILDLSSLVILGGIYGSVLSVSLWTALANYILKLFPAHNAKLIALGMLCFYFCDILVALDGLLKYSTAWILASSLIWVFYTPAITLLALSCYNYIPWHSLRTLLTSESQL